MFNNILEDAMFEVRRRWKSRVFIPLAIIGVIMLLISIGVGGVWLASNRAQPPQVNSSEIPLGSYAAGNVEVLYCIYQGASECTEYEKSKEWMPGATGGSLIYAPVEGDKNAPGESAGDGLLKVTNFQSLTDEEWHSLAAGATLEGKANPGTVTENSAKTSGFDPEQISATATFDIPSGGDTKPYTGTMSFTLTDSGVALKSITYSGGA